MKTLGIINLTNNDKHVLTIIIILSNKDEFVKHNNHHVHNKVNKNMHKQ